MRLSNSPDICAGLAGSGRIPPASAGRPDEFFSLSPLYLIDGYKPRTDMMSLDYTSLHVIALFSAMVGTLAADLRHHHEGFTLQSSRVVIMGSFAALLR